MLSWLSPRLAKYCRLGLLLPAAAAVLVLMTPAVGAPAKDAVPDLGYIFSPDLPHDVVALHAGAAGLQPSMDTMSWETLIALAWPASSTQNGVPDRNNQIGGIPPDPEGGSGKPAGPTVFESFKASEDIFLNPPLKPSGFNQPQRIPGPCLLQGASLAAHSKIMVRPTSIGATMNEVFEAFTNSPLIDQNGQYAWYEVRLDETEFNFIVNNQYYISTKQPPMISNFPAGSNTGKEAGSFHVKAAWKIMGANDDKTRFYTTIAFTYDPKAKQPCRRQTMGLVGLHIAHKTQSRPQWVWSTFEQVDNDPTKGIAPTQPRYSFNNPACKACPVNQQTTLGSTTPVQVLRITAIPPDKVALNAQYHQALTSINSKNVWQYYDLVDTQWPAEPTKKPLGNPIPAFLANSVLETFFQGPTVGPVSPKNPPHGCINCHGTYGLDKDFVFQLNDAYPQSKKKKTVIFAH